MNKVRVLLADDHPKFPEMTERLLGKDFEVVAKVGDGQAMYDEAVRLKPDVIVSDISMPILNGVDAAERLKSAAWQPRIIFLTVHADSELIRRCMSTGAFGYVLKYRIASELIPAIREAMAGHIFISQRLEPDNFS